MLIKYANNFEIGKNGNISSWKSEGLSEEKITNAYEFGTNFSPGLDSFVYFKGICLKHKK